MCAFAGLRVASHVAFAACGHVFENEIVDGRCEATLLIVCPDVGRVETVADVIGAETLADTSRLGTGTPVPEGTGTGTDAATDGTGAGDVTPPTMPPSAEAAAGMTVVASSPQIAARISRPTSDGLLSFMTFLPRETCPIGPTRQDRGLWIRARI
jgi:hypothetical protein